MKRKTLALQVKRQAREICARLDPEEDWEPVALFSAPSVEAFADFAQQHVPHLGPIPPGVATPQIIPVSLGDFMHDRDRLGLALGEMIAGMRPESVAMVQTIWYLTRDFADMDMANLPVPSEHPQRREGVLVIAVDREGVECYIAEVKRRPQLPPRLLPFERFPQDGGYTGRMIAPLIEAMGCTPPDPET